MNLFENNKLFFIRIKTYSNMFLNVKYYTQRIVTMRGSYRRGIYLKTKINNIKDEDQAAARKLYHVKKQNVELGNSGGE